jgi:chromate transporter
LFSPNLKEVALLFLKLDATTFGGPVVHIAIMRSEVVQKSKWISEQPVIITGGLAMLYKKYGQLPQVQPFIYGVNKKINDVLCVSGCCKCCISSNYN